MMSMFLLNLFLAAAYMVLTGDGSFFGFIVGFVIGYVIVLTYTRAIGGEGDDSHRGRYSGTFGRLLRFTGYFIYILVKANIDVAREIVTPGLSMTPRLIRYPVDGLTNVQITTLANAITLTPGTLSCDIDEDTRVLYVHAMYAKDRGEAIAAIDELRDKLLTEVFNQR